MLQDSAFSQEDTERPLYARPSAQFEMLPHLGLELFGKKTKYFKGGEQTSPK